MGTLLEVKHLKKYFNSPKGKVHAVDDVTFKIEEGKTMGVVGESGCGKSTLGRTIIHLQDSTDGQIIFDGKDVTKVDKNGLADLRNDMQIIFQDQTNIRLDNEKLCKIIEKGMESCGYLQSRRVSKVLVESGN